LFNVEIRSDFSKRPHHTFVTRENIDRSLEVEAASSSESFVTVPVNSIMSQSTGKFIQLGGRS
jgi:hypothetical protein